MIRFCIRFMIYVHLGMIGWSKPPSYIHYFSWIHCQTIPATDWVILPLFHKSDHYKWLPSFVMFSFLTFWKMHLTKQWTFSEQCIAASDSIIWFAAHPPFMWRSIVNSSLFNCAQGFFLASWLSIGWSGTEFTKLLLRTRYFALCIFPFIMNVNILRCRWKWL